MRFKILLIAALIIFSHAAIANEKQNKLASINLCSDEILTRLAEPSQIVALSSFAKDKKTKANAESIFAKSPDIVFAGEFNNREVVESLKRLGVKVITLKAIKNFEEVYQNIEEVAAAINEREKGNEIINEIKRNLNLIRRGEDKNKAKLRCVILQAGGIVSAADTFENEIVEMSGLKNLLAEQGLKGYVHLSIEKLIELAPEMLIFFDEQETPSISREIFFHPAVQKMLPNIKKILLTNRLINCGLDESVETVRKISNYEV